MLKGPQIVTVPKFDTPSRYWIVPFLDAYLNYYGAIGSYFNSTAGQYLVVGRSKNACSIYHELLHITKGVLAVAMFAFVAA